MLSETSIASMMVCCCDGSVMTAEGRAIAMIDTMTASRKSNGGTCLRTRCAGPSATFIRLKLAYRRAFFFLRRSSQTYAATSSGAASNNKSISGHWYVMGSRCVSLSRNGVDRRGRL